MENREEEKKKRGDSQNEQDPKEQKKSNRDIDREDEQSFPASDPPSYSKPGNDKKAD